MSTEYTHRIENEAIIEGLSTTFVFARPLTDAVRNLEDALDALPCRVDIHDWVVACCRQIRNGKLRADEVEIAAATSWAVAMYLADLDAAYTARRKEA